MLTHLAIRDLAIIEDTGLDLSPGLNALTGETGAGKSIIIDALALILGDRADVDLIRRGRDRAEVSAQFDLAPDSPTLALLDAHDLTDPDAPQQLLIRRIVAAAGKGRAYVNGRPVPIALLAELTRGLVDISSQHQHTQLLDPSTHLALLDRFGALTAERTAFIQSFSQLETCRAAERALTARAAERARREAFVRFQLQELEDLAPEPDEDTLLENEFQRLAHADRLVSGVAEVTALLAQQPGSVAERLTSVDRTLSRLRTVDAALAPLADRVDSVRIEITDLAHDLNTYLRHVDADPRRLDAVASRLEQLKRAAKKHGGSLTALIADRAALQAELAAFEALDLDVSDAAHATAQALAAANACAATLSKARHRARHELEARIAAELANLAMTGATLRFDLTPRDAIGPDGFETGEILLQSNQGEGFSPLAKTASGGELARVLLAMKRALMQADPVATCIFDEVDSGTGGAVGDMIGKTLHAIASERQVLVITHLASIAARASTHLRVTKFTLDDRTLTRVTRLTPEARETEIARMLGGIDLTDATRAHARELLALAHPAPAKL